MSEDIFIYAGISSGESIDLSSFDSSFSMKRMDTFSNLSWAMMSLNYFLINLSLKKVSQH